MAVSLRAGPRARGMERKLSYISFFVFVCGICVNTLADDSGVSLTYAYSTHGCGPIDQPVTMIYLTHDPVATGRPLPPYVQMWFAHGLDEQGRFEGAWNGPQGNMGGTWCRTAQDCVPVARGSLKLKRSVDDGTLIGDVEVDLGGPVGGPLRAEPLPAEHDSCG